MMKYCMKWLALVLMVAVLVCCATAGLAEGENGSLTVRFKDRDKDLLKDGVTLRLYRIGSEDPYTTWKLDEPYADSGYLEAKTAREIRNAIADIRAAVINSRAPIHDAKSNGNRNYITFYGLERGIYYGTAYKAPENVTIQDFVVSIPEGLGENAVLDAEVNVKYTVVTPTPAPSETVTPSPTPTSPVITPVPTPSPSPHPYTLTIYYIYDDGRTAWETYQATHWPGDKYSVTSPVIPGYFCSMKLVEGVMPQRDVEYTVIYSPKKAGRKYYNIDDYGTPLGLGIIYMHVGVCYE